MLTIKSVENQIQEIVNQNYHIEEKKDKESKKAAKAARTRIAYLNSIKLLLEAKPSESYLRDEIDRMRELKQAKMLQFPTWKEQHRGLVSELGDDKTVSAYYKRLFGFPKMDKQLKNIRFILNTN